MNEIWGSIGHHSAILAFVFALISCAYFFYHSFSKDQSNEVLTFGKITFFTHAIGVLMVVVSLFYIIYTHQYQYFYAWSHSSNELPWYYMISCFWEGQEGSFLLWTFWNVLLCIYILLKKDAWTSSMMAVMMLIQVVLTSMILGFKITGEFRIGSSPFVLLKDYFYDAPVFKNPLYVPENGNGLNPLLQNYWMVIHPPTLFLGFAMTQIPFVYAIVGLWKNEHKLWVKKAFSFSLVTAAVLGIGIMMGAFWAYETLNFGGYWNWDAVENAVFIPWLVLVALLHSFTLNERKNSALGLSYILAISTFVLILYSTFLTRSGILGNSSVHSFTDLGMSGQLLIFLFLFMSISIGLLLFRWKSIPKSTQEVAVYSPEFWVFAGILIFAFACLQILIPTSFPVINKIFNTTFAPPANQVSYYGQFQIWVGVLIGLVGGIAQFVWWNRIELKKLFSYVLNGISILVILMAFGYVVVFLMDADQGIYQKAMFENESSRMNKYTIRVVSYILLFVAGLFGIIMSFISLWKIRGNWKKLSGGALAHIGVGLMLIGFLFSSGYSKILSTNNEVISKEFTDEQNKENIVLWRHTPFNMGEYRITYSGSYFQPRNSGQYINLQDIQPTDSIGMGLIKNPVLNYKIGDTVFIPEENVYYKIDYQNDKDTFTIYPRVQRNEKMGGILPSPDIIRFPDKDIYSYIASVPMEGDEWSDTTYQNIGKGDTIIINDFIGFIDSIRPTEYISGVNVKEQLEKDAIAFTLYTHFLGKDGKVFNLRPSFMLRNIHDGASFFEVSDDMGVSMFVKDWPKPGITDKYVLGINTSAVDYVIFHAEKKPLINLVWIGTLLTAFGFLMAAVRRKEVLEG